MAWREVLSTGDQQRVAFARVFLDRPEMVFLDEATSALDVNNERRLYEKVSAMGCSYVSVGHRPSLVHFHDQVLLFTAPGEYELFTREEYLTRLAAEAREPFQRTRASVGSRASTDGEGLRERRLSSDSQERAD